MHMRFSDPNALLGIVDHLPTAVVIKNAELKFVMANHAFCDMIGKSENELLGKSDADFWVGDQVAEFIANDERVMLTGEESVVEEMATNQDGRTTVVLTRKTRMTAPDGRLYLLCIASDISALRKRENQYKGLTDNVPLGVAQVEEDMHVTFANPLFKLYCGGSGSEYEQERILQKLSTTNPGFPAKACKFETVIQGLGSEPRTMVVMSSGWMASDADRRSATVTFIDITQVTELQRVNEEVSRLNQDLAENMHKLKEAQDELVKRGRMEQLGQLTATVAHELRNPLGAVRTSAFLLDRKVKGAVPGVENLIDRINKGVTRCDNIITQLLDFSRNKQLAFQPGKLDDWLKGVIEEEARKLPAALNISVDLGLGDREIPFDPMRLQRAVVNLISNASEAMLGTAEQPLTNPTVDARILISTYFKDEFVSLRISDNGPGMKPDVLARIREPLFTTKSFGTGLGVPAVEQIAVQHGGRLDVRSTEGKGSVFTVWLPAQSPEVAEETAA
jgi:PAS domain S-box-containing protein